MYDLGVDLEQVEDLTLEERKIITEAVQKASTGLIETYRLTGRENLPSVSTEEIVKEAVDGVDLASLKKTTSRKSSW